MKMAIASVKDPLFGKTELDEYQTCAESKVVVPSTSK